jgi:hypothetical protein
MVKIVRKNQLKKNNRIGNRNFLGEFMLVATYICILSFYKQGLRLKSLLK